MNHPFSQFRFCPECGAEAFRINDFKSKRCAACGFTYFFNPAAATVAVIFNDKGELLVARRAEEPDKGTLDLPGGFVDSCETMEQGLLREVREETGLEVDIVRFLFSLPNIYPYSGFTVHTVDCFFLCSLKGSAEACPMDDVDKLSWVPLSDICIDSFGLNSIREGIERIVELKKREEV